MSAPTVDWVPGVSFGAAQVTSFLSTCSGEIVSGQVGSSSGSSAAVVVFTPGVGPWVAWTANPADPVALAAMAGALRDGVRGWANGDDPNDVAADAWRRREERRLARRPWSCETCGRPFKTQHLAEVHESRCCRRAP